MLYLIGYLLAVVLGGSINIGPFSIRVIATCLMMVYLFVLSFRKKQFIRIDRSYIGLYILFSFVMGFTLILNGEFEEFEFIKKVLAFNLVAIVSFLAIERIVKTSQQLIIIIITLLLIILINNVITILQYDGNPIGWAIGFLFGDIDKSVQKIGDHDSLLGMSVTPGIFGDVVKNALYIAVITPLSFCLFRKDSNIFTILFSLLVIASSIIAVIMTQQRAAFAVVTFTIFMMFLIIFKKHFIALFCAMFLSGIVLFILGDFIENIDLGRLTDSSNTSRERLTSQAIDFILDHPVLGGPVSFLRKAGLPAHNLIFDTYIHSGLLGFVIMMVLLTKTVWESCKNIVKGIKLRKDSNLVVFSAIGVLSTMAYGFLHNTSFLSGEVIVFILLVIMLKVDRLFI